MSLLKAGVSGIGWNTSSRVFRQIVQIITYLVLAKLLEPSAFGLIAMALVITQFLTVFRDMGISFAIIQKKDVSDLLLSSAFWLNIGIALTLVFLVNMAAPLVAHIYNEPDVIPVLRVLSSGIFLTSLTILHQAVFEKDLNFKFVAKYEITGTIIGSIIGISMAYSGFGVWSIVAQSLTNISITSAFLWFGSKWKPSFIFSWAEVKPIMGFSLNSLGFNVMNYLLRNVDKFIIGRYLGKEALGLYNYAYKISLIPLQNISSVFVRVMFPIFSKLQDDDKKFKETYMLMTLALGTVTFPLMLGIAGIADLFVEIFFEPQWYPLKELLIVFAGVGMIQSVFTQTGHLFMSKNKTHIQFWWGFFTSLLFVASYIIGINWGILGVAVAYLIANIIIVLPGLKIPLNYFSCKVVELFNNLKEVLAISFFMLGILIILKYILIDNMNKSVLFYGLIVTGISLYIVLYYTLNRTKLNKLIQVIKKRNNEV